MLGSLARAARMGATRRVGTFSSATPTGVRSKSTASGPGIPPALLTNWYNIFGKSNVAYITWIVGGILVAEGFTGGMTDMLWSSANSGRLYESVDWTKFIVEDDDDDDDEDEDEDEEEGDDDGDDDEE
mmetsp:Transcript_27011/g.77923  ORF Transcript_27011/g.77923 Transcript_27011/m.77923 type:complete len:128 (-) Transcript_27011:74-457(-)